MEATDLLERVVDETTRIVDNVSDDQLATASPCEGWTVRDVINHITGGATMFAVSAEQGTVPDDVLAKIMGDNLGSDFKSAWGAAARQAVAAFRQPGVLDKVVTLPFGQMPANIAITIAVFDLATHACDIANATGQEIGDEQTFGAALEIGRQIVTDDLRQPGYFDAAQPAPEGASLQEEILAFAGRRI
jgi:uncharacterized protein (TIGR03086 family)